MHQVPRDIAECFERNSYGIRKFHGQTHVFLSRDLGDSIGGEELKRICYDVWTKDELDRFCFRRDFYRNEISYSIEVPPSHIFIEGEYTPDDLLAEIFVYRLKTYRK
ncbi:hypothetical protein HYU23_04030 [Candidatus Woesearchaeota archaeon]|nr:hypothetical protein [Candidatus Woesearchaeota archaeon]